MTIETNAYFWDEINGHLCGFTTAGITTSIGAGTTYLLTHAINIMPIGASIALFLNALRIRSLSAQANPVTQTQLRWQARLGALSLIYLGTKALLPTLPTLINAMTLAIGISPVATTAAALALAVILLSLAAMCVLYHCETLDMKNYKCIDTLIASGCGATLTGITYVILSVLNTPWISNGLLTVAASTISTAAAATLLPLLALGIGYLTYQLLSPPDHATQKEKPEVISPTHDGDTRTEQHTLYPNGFDERKSVASSMSDRGIDSLWTTSPPIPTTQEKKHSTSRAISPIDYSDTRTEQHTHYPYGYDEGESVASSMSDRGSIGSFKTAQST